jgi:hypothetical protein
MIETHVKTAKRDHLIPIKIVVTKKINIKKDIERRIHTLLCDNKLIQP